MSRRVYDRVVWSPGSSGPARVTKTSECTCTEGKPSPHGDLAHCMFLYNAARFARRSPALDSPITFAYLQAIARDRWGRPVEEEGPQKRGHSAGGVAHYSRVGLHFRSCVGGPDKPSVRSPTYILTYAVELRRLSCHYFVSGGIAAFLSLIHI